MASSFDYDKFCQTNNWAKRKINYAKSDVIQLIVLSVSRYYFQIFNCRYFFDIVRIVAPN